jgi:hypothetical protein
MGVLIGLTNDSSFLDLQVREWCEVFVSEYSFQSFILCQTAKSDAALVAVV